VQALGSRDVHDAQLAYRRMIGATLVESKSIVEGI
jgi:hypothetical protein